MDDRASKLKGLVWLIAACLLGAALALGLSPLAHAVPWRWEKGLAAALPMGPRQECTHSEPAQARLRRLVNRIYPIEPDDAAFSIEIRIVKDATINAYAALGGEITVNSGLLKQAETPEEIAGVLAHEIEHVRHRHILERAIAQIFTSEGLHAIFGTSSSADWAGYFLKMDFTRSQEAQADEGGLQRLQRARVDNQGFKNFFERMEKAGAAQPFLSDHPSNAQRIEMVEKFSNVNATPIMTQGEWEILRNYCAES